MTPKSKARQVIDRRLDQAGWAVQDMQHIDLDAAQGVGRQHGKARRVAAEAGTPAFMERH